MEFSSVFGVGTAEPQTVRVLSGCRGAGKTTRLRQLLSEIEAASPQVRTVYVDVEEPAFRNLRTADLMAAHVLSQVPEGCFRLVLDEPGHFAELVPLVRQIQESGRCTAVYVALSGNWRLKELQQAFRISHCHIREPYAGPLPPEERMLIIYKTLVRDVLCHGRCLDAAGPGHFCYWLAENLGEKTSLRKIATAMARFGSRVSHPTVDAYLTALQNAYLVERIACWDLFGNELSRSGFKIAVNAMAYFVHAFAFDVEKNAKAVAWNAAYFELRRTHDVVYFPNCAHADFVTLEKGRPVCWLVTPDGHPVLRDPA